MLPYNSKKTNWVFLSKIKANGSGEWDETSIEFSSIKSLKTRLIPGKAHKDERIQNNHPFVPVLDLSFRVDSASLESVFLAGERADDIGCLVRPGFSCIDHQGRGCYKPLTLHV
jgi:hypothetical protein